MSLRLFLDTARRVPLVALFGSNGQVLDERTPPRVDEDRRGWSLFTTLEAMLADAGTRPAELEAVVVTLGPGPLSGTRVGLAIARDYGAGTVFYAGQSLIELAGHGGPNACGTIWLQVRDVYATEKDLAARGVPIAREAREEPWGLHEMHVHDPDGVTLIFVQVPETHPLRRDTRN